MNKSPTSLRKTIRLTESRAGSLILQWMTPTNAGKVLVVVEGPDDKHVYGHLFDSSASFIRDCDGCNTVRGVCEYVRKNKHRMVAVGILDSDFRRVCGRALRRPNIVYTDTHDLETLIMFSPYCYSRFCWKAGITNIPDHNEILQDLSLLSFMRWYNMSAHLSYTDFDLNLESETSTHLRDYAFMCKKFIPTEGSCKTWIKRCFDRFQHDKSSAPLEQVVNGHDYIARFCYYVRVLNGLTFTKEDKNELLTYALDVKYFQTTELHRQLVIWENNNRVNILV